MTPADLDALEAKARAARTPRPWEAPACLDLVEAEHVAAASPDVVLALVAEVRRLRAELAEAKQCNAVLDEYAMPEAHLR